MPLINTTMLLSIAVQHEVTLTTSFVIIIKPHYDPCDRECDLGGTSSCYWCQLLMPLGMHAMLWLIAAHYQYGDEWHDASYEWLGDDTQ